MKNNIRRMNTSFECSTDAFFSPKIGKKYTPHTDGNCAKKNCYKIEYKLLLLECKSNWQK